MKIIAIESSHDDTSVVLYDNKKILKEWSYSQTDFHKMYGGTVPEFAARGHFDRFPEILDELLKEDLKDINHIAYTDTPGLIGSLHMGRLFAKSLALALNIEAKPINHMYGHIFAVEFTKKIKYPAVALIASGGHTQLWNVKDVNNIELIGQTLDDAAGEAYDKVARALKLGFPGGPLIDKLYDEKLIDKSFDLINKNDFNFSFSGLKTKVKNYVNTREMKSEKIDVAYIATNFQHSIVKTLIDKTQKAIDKYKPKSIILGGGVSANSLLRDKFLELHKNALIPEMRFTTDNAMMIAIRSAIKEGEND